MSRIYSHILLVILLSCNPTPEYGPESITSEKLLNIVNYLASPELDGRLAGTEGYEKASEYGKNRFIKAGLKPAFGEDYYQYFELETNEILGEPSMALYEGEKKLKDYKIGDDFICRGFTGAGDITAPVVFCGYGISSEEAGYDDYANVDVNGRIAAIFKYNPKWKIEEKAWPDVTPRVKAAVAKSHGAIGIILLTHPTDFIKKPIGSVAHGEEEHLPDFPMAHIDSSFAADLFHGCDISLDEAREKIDSLHKPLSFELSRKVNINIKTKYNKSGRTQNIAGKIEGNDPELKDEYIIIGAHLDHVGRQGPAYFPGANDNASGAAAVTALAEAFANPEMGPKRSMIFVLFAAEESGLEGAFNFVKNSPVPYEKIAAMFNFDCVGTGDSIRVGNGKSAPELWSMINKTDSLNTKMMIDATWSGGGADATPFHREGIPCAYFVTSNSYKHLHQITDTPETLNPALFEKLVRLAYYSAEKVANGEYTREVIVN